MSEQSLDHASPADLARIMASASEDAEWSDADLASMLRHQMSSRLLSDLTLHGSVSHEDALTVSAMPTPPVETFAELFAHPEPPVKLLVWTKDFAKRCRADADSGVPTEITAVLYFVSIALAQVRCGKKISELSKEQVAAGLDWLLQRSWIDKTNRALIERLRARYGE